MKKSLGFTVIEVILSLIILGIVGTIGAMGFSNAVQGFLHAADNTEIVHQAQLVINRLTYDFNNISFSVPAGTTDALGNNLQFSIDNGSGVSSSSNTAITYDVAFYGSPPQYALTTTQNALTYNSGTQQILIDGNVLSENVSTFILRYFNNSSSASGANSFSYTYPVDSSDRYIIGVTLGFTGPSNGTEIRYTFRVVPKNVYTLYNNAEWDS